LNRDGIGRPAIISLGSALEGARPFVIWTAVFLLSVGIVGPLADFLAGAKFQTNVKDWLLTKWVAFDDLNLAHFSEKEAAYFVRLSDGLFGARLFTWRRLLVSVGMTAICIVYWYIRAGQLLSTYPPLSEMPQWELVWNAKLLGLATAFAVLSFALSVSANRWLSLQAIAFSHGHRTGLLPYVILVCIHVLLLLYLGEALFSVRVFAAACVAEWTNRYPEPLNVHRLVGQLSYSLRSFDFHPVRPGSYLYFAETSHSRWWARPQGVIVSETDNSLAYIANAVRLATSFGILITFIFKRWIARLVDLIWRRLVEHNLGIFTLIGIGFGALGSLIAAIAKLLST
jgi:hypothetical protein